MPNLKLNHWLRPCGSMHYDHSFYFNDTIMKET